MPQTSLRRSCFDEGAGDGSEFVLSLRYGRKTARRTSGAQIEVQRTLPTGE
jgi:hypothetical protein